MSDYGMIIYRKNIKRTLIRIFRLLADLLALIKKFRLNGIFPETYTLHFLPYVPSCSG